MDKYLTGLLLSGIVLMLSSEVVFSHGGMVEPPMRSIMWRYGFETPVNYDWNALYCGGRQNFIKHKGRCGLCGDPVQGPYENDKGGIYDNGIIVRHYPAGLQEIEVKVEITAHHKGFFQFKLCANNEDPITQECLNRYPLPIREGLEQGNPLQYYPPETPKLHELHVALPPDVVCDRCVLQWTYTAGNSFGQAEDGRSCLGCGYQETFVNCADISIGGSKDQIPVHKEQHQVGGVVEIGGGPEVSVALDNVKPDASVRDVLRELGVVFPQDTSPPAPVSQVVIPQPVVRPALPPVVPPAPFDSQPNRVILPPSIVDTPLDNSMLVRPQIPHGHAQQIPRPIPQPMSNIPMTGQNIPANVGGWDIADSLQNNFQPRPLHNMLLDISRPVPEIPFGLNPTINEIERRRQQEIVSAALAHSQNKPNVPKVPDQAVVQSHVSTNYGQPEGQPLLDAVYALRDHVPKVDIYGRYQGLTPFGEPARHDPSLRGRQLVQHYADKFNHLGHEMHNSFTDYHNEQYKATMQGGEFSNFDNSLPHRTKQINIIENQREMSVPRHSRLVLPRRIMVHSMAVAERLVRTYPQLRGRVYLSRRAHMKNKYANTLHRYSRRQRHF